MPVKPCGYRVHKGTLLPIVYSSVLTARLGLLWKHLLVGQASGLCVMMLLSRGNSKIEGCEKKLLSYIRISKTCHVSPLRYDCCSSVATRLGLVACFDLHNTRSLRLPVRSFQWKQQQQRFASSCSSLLCRPCRFSHGVATVT